MKNNFHTINEFLFQMFHLLSLEYQPVENSTD